MSMLTNRIVITGIGMTAPNGNGLDEFRQALLSAQSGVSLIEHRYIGKVPAGMCEFDAKQYQNKKELRSGTRAGSIAIYCANEAIMDASVEITDANRSRYGIYIGTTEHGTVETEHEVYQLSQCDYDLSFWSHHHNPRSIANNPAGEVTINLKTTGPHLCVGAACAAGNCGIIQGIQQLLLGEVDVAVAGGVSESSRSFGIFASFKSQGALAEHSEPQRASRPYDINRNGIVVSEGGCLYILERLEDAKKRGAHIYAEIVGYSMNSDALDPVLPSAERQAECFNQLLARTALSPEDIDLINTHATGTPTGDAEEIRAIRKVFGDNTRVPLINNTKGFIGHTMGAAGALELAGNLPGFKDGLVHPCMNLDELDPKCAYPNIVQQKPEPCQINYLINASFGMLGNNSVLLVKRYE